MAAPTTQEVQQQLQTLQLEMNKLTSERNSLRRQLDGANKILFRREYMNAAARARVTELEQEQFIDREKLVYLKEIKHVNRYMEANYNKVKNALTETTATLAAANERKDLLKLEMDRLRAEIEALQNELLEKQRKREEEPGEEPQVKQAKPIVKKLDKIIESLSVKKKDLPPPEKVQEQLLELITDIEQIGDQNMALADANDLPDTQTKLTQTESRAKQLEARVKELEEANRELEAEDARKVKKLNGFDINHESVLRQQKERYNACLAEIARELENTKVLMPNFRCAEDAQRQIELTLNLKRMNYKSLRMYAQHQPVATDSSKRQKRCE